MKPFQDFIALPKKLFSRYCDLHSTTNFPNSGSIFDKILCKQVASLTLNRYSNGNVSCCNFKSLDVSFLSVEARLSGSIELFLKRN